MGNKQQKHRQFSLTKRIDKKKLSNINHNEQQSELTGSDSVGSKNLGLNETRNQLGVDSIQSSKPVDERRFGVSLQHLASLPIDVNSTFHEASAYVKLQTISLEGYRSYANFLRSNTATRNMVKEQAEVFVSYAWNGRWGPTMDALKAHFDGKDVFVWMDFAIVDQHFTDDKSAAAVDFDELARTFGENLRAVEKAVLVLTPGKKPVAISRSWCCFEWTTIVEAQIKYEFCVPKPDESRLIQEIKEGQQMEYYQAIFSDIDIEQATAAVDSDRIAILERLRAIGVVKVNDIVQNSLKSWLLSVARKAEEESQSDSIELVNVVRTRGALHQALVSLGLITVSFSGKF